MKENKKHCCLCGKEFKGYGNNPWPLSKNKNDRCCDDCNRYVILERLYEWKDCIEEKEIEGGRQ